MELRVGQVVLYSPVGGMQHFGLKLASIVTHIHDNGRVNLCIFDPYGNIIQNPPSSIELDRISMVEPVIRAVEVPSIKSGNPILDVTGDLPAGAKLVESRPATAEEVASVTASAKKLPKKPKRLTR